MRSLRLDPPRLRAYLLALCALLAACGGNQPAKAGSELRTIRLEAPLPESPEHDLLGGTQPSHYGLLRRLYSIAADHQVSGVLLTIGEMGGAWGRVADLRDALASIRKRGKKVHCHFETTDNLGYALLARSCDRISMTPAGMLNLVGVSAEALYAHSLLQNLGLEADVVQIGKYKGAGDPLTRDDMPPEVQQTMNAVLDELQARLLSALVQGRHLDPARAQALVDQGPFSADDARAAGLVDAVEFDDAARAVAKSEAHAARVVKEQLRPAHESIGLGDLLRALKGGGAASQPSGKRVVLAVLEGTILRGSPGSFRGAHAEAFVPKMRALADDANVKAVVLRINSPGGSALAADLMWHAVRRVAKRKPVIVSIGDLCASGGYYVASAGSQIVAPDESLVGSIGVVGGKLVFRDLTDRIGVHFQRLARGKHAGWESPTQPFSDEERARFDRMLRQGYALFVSRIAEGRGLKAPEIEPYAEGRLMTGRRARQGRLIDAEGGLVTALAIARKRGGVPPDAAIEIWPQRPGLLQAVAGLASGGGAQSLLASGLDATQRPGIAETLLSGEGTPAAVLPFTLSLR